MKLSDVNTVSDSFTDEVQSAQFSISYANQAISEINAEVGLILPFIKTVQEEYTALPDTWFHRLIGWFISYGIKMNDGSMNEALEYKDWFLRALQSFKEVAVGSEENGAGGLIDPEYIDQLSLSQKFARMETRKFIDSGWFR